MNALLILTHFPYDKTDMTWHSLCLAEQLLKLGISVHIFLINEAVDLAHESCKPYEDYCDLGQMLRDLISKGIQVKACSTHKMLGGIYQSEPYFKGVHEATREELAEWIKEADKIINL